MTVTNRDINNLARYIELHGGNARPFKRGKASVRMRVVNAIMEEEASKVFVSWRGREKERG